MNTIEELNKRAEDIIKRGNSPMSDAAFRSVFNRVVNFLEKCAAEYETNGKSSLSDAEYDKLYYGCKKLNGAHLFFQNVGGLDKDAVTGAIVKHEVKMGSLSKSHSPEEFYK